MATSQSINQSVECRLRGCHTRGRKWEFTDGEYCSSDHKCQDIIRSRTGECASRYCDNTVTERETATESFCTDYCDHAEHGARLLGVIERRHELCRTCFRLRKDIERPPAMFMARHFDRSGTGWSREGEDGEWTVERWGQELSRDAVCGFAYGTEHAEMGPYGLECVCGAIESDTDEPAVRDVEDWPYWLALAVEYLADIGAREDTLSPRVVEHAYEREENLPWAIGFALDW